MQEQKAVRVIVMSDTHDFHHNINVSELPEADIFIHCGDFTQASSIEELASFRQFLTSLPYKHKIVVAGNHDFNLDKNYWEKESKKTKQETIP
jgi:predicted phosphodiesterase